MKKRRVIQSDPAMDELLSTIKVDLGDDEPGEAAAATPTIARARPLLLGKIALNHRGFAFATTETGDAYFVRAVLARPLLSGDWIEFEPVDASISGGNMEVRVVRGVRRQASVMLCEVAMGFSSVELRPDEPCSLMLQLDSPLTAFTLGDVLAVNVPAYEGAPSGAPVAVALTRNLGQRSRPGFDLDYAMVRYGFDEVMPEHLGSQELAGLSVMDDKPEAWKDHGGIPFVTIDGESTRDFDDAVYASPREDGGWDVLVAIADVSWYVTPGSELDKWASRRCTSLYLPGRTEPMLPESLSNERCSLLPGELKRAVVMELVLDANGVVQSSQLRRSVIQSAARLTYNQVAAFLAGKAIRFAQPVESNLNALAEVYALLSRQREQAGRLEFDDPEPMLVQNGEGGWKLSWETRNEAHKVVEELMLLANRVAAATLVNRYGAGLFRHQPPPDAEAWSGLRAWAQSESHELPPEPCMRALANLASAMPNGDAQAAAALRIRSAMQPAKYVVNDGARSGHFSLSVTWYTHFTSPIRRYADLLVHRLLLAPEGTQLTAEEWDALSAQVLHCSDRAYAARMAERQVWDRLKLSSFLTENPVGSPVPARIMRATARGLRMVIQGWQCSAWLPSEALRAQGYDWRDNEWCPPDAANSARPLQEGFALTVRWMHLSRDRPAYPELLVEMATAA